MSARPQPSPAPAPSRRRLIKRRINIRPEFHETDMMGVVHNAAYFHWFERGRLQIMQEVLPFAEAVQLGVVTPVVENVCYYRKPVRFGDSLLLYTTHEVQTHYEGKLVFHHYLVQERRKTANAHGHTVLTLVDANGYRLVKEWPTEVWERYQALA